MLHALCVGAYSSLTFSLLMTPKCGMKVGAERGAGAGQWVELATETLQERPF